MNEVVVGVKRINKSMLAEPGEEANAAYGAMWITIDGREFPTDGSRGLIAVHLEASSEPLAFQARTLKPSSGEEGGFLTVTTSFVCSSFRTVDYRDPVHAPERFRAVAVG